MTDAPDLTPEQDAVRRLLADARHEGSTPPEVVARLDDTLASLVAERADAPRTPDAPVVDLGARRRRTAGIGLLAAAAVVVAGVAIGQGLPQMSGSDSSADSSAGGDADAGRDREEDGSALDDGSATDDSGAGAAELAPESLKSPAATPGPGHPTLSAFAADLDEDLLDLRTTTRARGAGAGSGQTLLACDVRGTGPGRRVLAEVDGRDGVVVFARPSGEAQDVAIYVCGDSVPVRTLTLPAP
jgi:hypothetical protein